MDPSAGITRIVRGIIAEVGELDPSLVTGSARLEDDLGFDSLRLVGLAMALEEEFTIGQVDETAVLDIVTVQDVEGLILQIAATRR
jgi:acyl carrier protein